ncbi:ABC transporter permease [Rathayibacter sp. VKM Ac-2754]|uniref:ABC transporter permease n=1 Tax=Rathayibacter sp. VKM Ac-2754 TaxID=2609251 RepID=UPI00135CBD09|nr:ABC transporter permease [Rathayibacter sp. VKM Ac-2754]MWV60777.1 ABC transporter permease [Rathayibacter sp. VKM Ac-2754]
MTALTDARPRTGSRLLAVVRLHFANPATILYTPFVILMVIFLGNLAVWWLILQNLDTQAEIDETTLGMQYSGATFFIFVYMMVVAVQAVNISFGLALGYGSTRREFSLGSAVTFIGLSFAWTALFAVLGGLEESTDGWGFGGNFFRSIYFGDGSLLERVFAVLCAFLFFFFVGAATASAYVRWRQRGMLVFFTVLGALVLGAVTLLTLTESWGEFGAFFARVGFVGGYALSLIPTALAALAGHLILRRATPRG